MEGYSTKGPILDYPNATIVLKMRSSFRKQYFNLVPQTKNHEKRRGGYCECIQAIISKEE